MALCSGQCGCSASVPLSCCNTGFCIGVVGADTLLESFVFVKLDVCSTPFDNKSVVVISDSCSPCQTACVVLGWLLLLRWLYKQGASVVLEKSAEEMLSLGLLRRSPVCDT